MSKYLFILVLVIINLTGCAATTHHRIQRFLLAETTGIIMCDYGQTMYMNHGDKWDAKSRRGWLLHEANPLLGPYPSQTEITVANVAALIGNAVVYKLPIPDWLKTTYYSVVAVVETANVMGNVAHQTGYCGMQTGDEKYMQYPTRNAQRNWKWIPGSSLFP